VKHEKPFQNEREFARWFTACAVQQGWKVAHFGNTVKWVRRKEEWTVIPDSDAAGFPDMICVRERLLVAELKLAPRKPTAKQVDWLEALNEAGVETHVWSDRQLPEIERCLATRIEPKRMARLYLASDGNVDHSVAVAHLLALKEGGTS
jgi:hypothetical protein